MKEHLGKLELDTGANWKEVQRAYRDMLKVWHPDRFGSDQSLRKKAEEKTRLIIESYQHLKDNWESWEQQQKYGYQPKPNTAIPKKTYTYTSSPKPSADSKVSSEKIAKHWENYDSLLSQMERRSKWSRVFLYVVFTCFLISVALATLNQFYPDDPISDFISYEYWADKVEGKEKKKEIPRIKKWREVGSLKRKAP